MTTDARPGRLRIDISELREHPGTIRRIELITALEEIRVGEVMVAEGTPITLDLLLEGIQGGIDVTGTVSAEWSGPCRRCLDPVTGELRAEVHEIFAEDHEPGETYPVERLRIDLTEMTRDVILLGLPLAPLCRPDCAGPAPSVFPLSSAESDAEDEDDRAERPKDPRWAALDQLRDQFVEDSEPPDAVG